MLNKRMELLQGLALAAIFLFLLLTTPTNWIQFPDSGYYVGTSENLLAGLGYWFNGYPNLQYYPGTSLLISLPMIVVGDHFGWLQGFMALVSLTGVALIAYYFRPSKFGVPGLIAPFLVLTSSVFSVHIYALLSDALFLTLSILALVIWQQYEKNKTALTLLLCVAVITFATLVRFQGLFLGAAFGIALLLMAFNETRDKRLFSVFKVLIIGGLTLTPFCLWTLRNYLEFTPDTFNMANEFFFGDKGLRIYAHGLSGDVSSAHVNSAWEFAYLRSSLFVGGIFESWYGGMSQINRTIVSVAICTLFAFGVAPWAKRATKLELAYIIISLLYLAKAILFVKNLHIVYRYWVPMLPFIVIICGLGVKAIVDLPWLQKLKPVSQWAACLFAVGLLVLASPNLTKHLRQADKYADEALAVEKLTEFAKQLPEDAIVATVDWGILPRALNRQSYQVLNDPTFIHTVTRMAKYQTNYLVTYGKFGRMNRPAKKMIETYPELFEKQFSVFDDKPNTQIEVYKVDIKELEKAVLLSEN